MPSFDQSKAYAEQEEVFFDDGREIELLHFIYNLPDLEEIRGSPQRVLEAIDRFGRTKKYLMNVGEDKGRIVTGLIAERKPEVMVELGGYIGYSAILFGDALRRAGGTRYYTLERNPEFGAVIAALVALAGLADTVHVEIGSSDASLQRLHHTHRLPTGKIDLVFLDHYKPAYTTDLKLCEELGLVREGSWLAADNVIKPGNPPYLAYVRSSVAEKRERYAAAGEGEEDVEGARGNPNLVYESRLVESFEPTGEPDGIEITKCVGEEKDGA
ncbi:catechol O-methyltransferase 2 [Lecanosticta acicola]|uniref:catechol O-methyltransferase n=1 Tax=Lecanosticta acicola TaxID=111012 RepID=A0AAI8Z8U5_9PEZI|nr:catechol O-methyltransferase 2 [Lecanosticta acicola]